MRRGENGCPDQLQGSQKSQRAKALRDFWEEEERSAHASIAPWGDARALPTAPTRGRFSKGVALERAF